MFSATKGRNVAGIIPLAGYQNNLGSPLPDYLQLISSEYTALERSVYECCFAGCDSIWIVCNDDVSPVVRSLIGDYVMNPKIYKTWNKLKNHEEHKEYIPVFYVPVLRKHRNRRDSLGWSILDGSLTAYKISKSITKWSTPSKYYVSFPCSIYNPEAVFPFRAKIRGPESFYLSHENQTVKDGKYLGFTFSPEDWRVYKKFIRENCTGGSKDLHPKERWSSRNFSVDKIFNRDTISIDIKIELDSCFDMNSWNRLIEYYRSDSKLMKPHKDIIKPYRKKDCYETK